MVSRFAVNAAMVGKPYSGKTEICEYLAQSANYAIISPEKLVTALINNPTPDMEQLSVRAKHSLSQGKVLDDEIIVDLILHEIKRIESSSENYSGWIIDSFPSSVSTAKLLELKITGVAERDPKSEKTSIIAPHDANSHAAPISCKALTSVILVDVSNEEVFARASAQLVDPVTGEMYHETLRAPPHIVSRIIYCNNTHCRKK